MSGCACVFRMAILLCLLNISTTGEMSSFYMLTLTGHPRFVTDELFT